MKRCLSLLFLFIWVNVSAQTRYLTQRELFDIVQSYHPVARQAALDIEMAKADILIARGAFDPVLQTSNARKEVDNILYYDQAKYEVKVPVWYGLDIEAGMESVNGSKTNPMDTKGSSSYIGFSMPVVKNLLIDKRRATLRQAGIFQNMSETERRAVLNDLLQDASKAYWNWWEQHAVYQLFTNALENAERRFQMVKTSYKLGERPAIDTLEALAQLQSIRLRQSELNIQLNTARLELSVFLWQKNDMPYELPADVLPEKQTVEIPESMMSVDQLLGRMNDHPELQQYEFKLESLQIDRRLKFQSLLPSVYVKYNQLTKGHNLSKSFSSPLLDNNYRYGVSVSVPLRLSEGRGEFRKAKLKIERTKLEQLNKRVNVEAKIRQSHFEWQQLGQQLQLQQRAVSMYQSLQRGEEIKFFNGESSLFVINSREAKTLESQQKLIELQSKYQKAINKTLWSSGQLAQQ